MKTRTPLPKLGKKKLAALGDKPLPWSTISKPSGSPRKQPKKKRTKSEKERIYGPPGYVEWIHDQPCIACGVVGFSEVAHIRTGGLSRKDDWIRTVPLCASHPIRVNERFVNELFPGHHRVLHHLGRQPFERYYALNLDTCAAETQLAWSSRIQEIGA